MYMSHFKKLKNLKFFLSKKDLIPMNNYFALILWITISKNYMNNNFIIIHISKKKKIGIPAQKTNIAFNNRSTSMWPNQQIRLVNKFQKDLMINFHEIVGVIID